MTISTLKPLRNLRMYSRMWRLDQITLGLDPEATDDPVATVHFDTPAGRIIIMAEIAAQDGSTLELTGLHTHCDGAAPKNTIGAANLMQLAQKLMEMLSYDEVVVTGARRETGAYPGRPPRRSRIARHARPMGEG